MYVVELEIYPDKIKQKYITILLQSEGRFRETAQYEDMSGAIFVMFIFGMVLLLVSHNFEAKK